MPELRLGHEPNERSTSPPSPTAHWDAAQEISVQAPTLQFAGASRAGGPAKRADPSRERAGAQLDLSAFAPAASARAKRWRHDIRHFDRQFRLALPEVVELLGFDGVALAATLRRGRWELRPLGRERLSVAIDPRRRVLVPPGVRHQLGLDGAVLVSLALDRSHLVIWPATSLDALLENTR